VFVYGSSQDDEAHKILDTEAVAMWVKTLGLRQQHQANRVAGLRHELFDSGGRLGER
jgi:hypothetical protein